MIKLHLKWKHITLESSRNPSKIVPNMFQNRSRSHLVCHSNRLGHCRCNVCLKGLKKCTLLVAFLARFFRHDQPHDTPPIVSAHKEHLPQKETHTRNPHPSLSFLAKFGQPSRTPRAHHHFEIMFWSIPEIIGLKDVRVGYPFWKEHCGN